MNCSKYKDFGYLVLRLFVGGTFVFHGILKLQSMTETIAFFNSIGFASYYAYIVTYVEVIAGALLVLGAFSLYASILLAIVMMVAAFKVKWGIPEVPFINRYLLSEFDLSLLASLVCLIFTGAGRYSVMEFCRCHKNDSECKVCKIGGCQHSCSSSNCDGPKTEVASDSSSVNM